MSLVLIGVKFCMMVHRSRTGLLSFRERGCGAPRDHHIRNFGSKFWPFHREYLENGKSQSQRYVSTTLCSKKTCDHVFDDKLKYNCSFTKIFGTLIVGTRIVLLQLIIENVVTCFFGTQRTAKIISTRALYKCKSRGSSPPPQGSPNPKFAHPVWRVLCLAYALVFNVSVCLSVCMSVC